MINEKIEYFDKTLLNKQLNTAFHDKSPKGKIFFNTGAKNGAYLRKEMGYNTNSIDNWIEQGADGCRGFLSSQITDAVGDMFERSTKKTNTSLENAFVCWSATFHTIINKNDNPDMPKTFSLKKSEKCISRYTAITCDLDFKDLPEERQIEFGTDGYKFWDYIKTNYVDTYLIPLPTFVNASGRGGLHIIWVLEESIPNNYNNRKNINLIYQSYYYIQTILPATDRTCMPDHWLRVPGSLNQKQGKYYQCREIFFSGEYTPLQVWYDIICSTKKETFDPTINNNRCPFEYLSKKDIRIATKKRKKLALQYEQQKLDELSAALSEQEATFINESFNYDDIEDNYNDDIVDNYIEEENLNEEDIEETIIEKKYIPKKNISEVERNDGWYHFKRNDFIIPTLITDTYHYIKMRDLADLLVNSRDKNIGAYRELILFYITIHSFWYYDEENIDNVKDNVKNNLLIICNKMKNSLDDNEIEHIIDTAFNYYLKGKNYEAVYQGQRAYERFRLTSIRYIELFKITSDEIIHLRSIITKEEAKNRKAIRNKQYYKSICKISKKENILFRQKQIAIYMLNHPNCTNDEIMKTFNISKRTVQNDKKVIILNNMISDIIAIVLHKKNTFFLNCNEELRSVPSELEYTFVLSGMNNFVLTGYG